MNESYTEEEPERNGGATRIFMPFPISVLLKGLLERKQKNEWIDSYKREKKDDSCLNKC